MDHLSPSPGRSVAAYASQVVSESQVELRRSQRLLEKESRLKTKAESLTKSGSPQLFEETDEEWSQPLLCQQKPLPQIVHQEQVAAKRRLSSSFVEEAVSAKRRKGRPAAQVKTKNAYNSIRFSNEQQRNQSDVVKSTSWNSSTIPQKVLPLRQSNGGSLTQGKPKQLSSFRRHETAHQKQSPSKLPPKYPAHFLHQLPPLGAGGGDRSYMHMRPKAAPAVQLREMCPTPEFTPVAGPQKATFVDRSLSPPNPCSESSDTLSLSDSIGEIFGTKNISCILNIECPRQYILLEDHLPAMAMMLNVELVRLRAVLDLTQRLTHEQILNWPLKLEKPTKD
ncbi:meiotic recombination protein P22 [Drosophila subobscura]|uniref:meiotic recombination protein P22 n=1 Tax=Drosophila subobscura TaxID=7241 RepID=UPI00155B02C3|nr:meiotic recombination protein P22 [Drosophila subobscura]